MNQTERSNYGSLVHSTRRRRKQPPLQISEADGYAPNNLLNLQDFTGCNRMGGAEDS